MKLYSHFERVDRELAADGKTSDVLKPEDLFPYDHMNYCGTAAVENAVKMLGITSSSKVLDLGSGLGGPARFISQRTGASITAVELQQDCSTKASDYTRRCGLQQRITHVCADFVTCDLAATGLTLCNDNGGYDSIVSWLVILHIREKQELFRRAVGLLKPESSSTINDSPNGGQIYIEDFYQLNDFTAVEAASLTDDVYCQALLTKDAYVSALEQAGFAVEAFDDMTSTWIEWVTKRRINYIANREDTLRKHNDATYDSQLYFFSAIVTLFQGGNLGGCRIVARRVCLEE
jgi:cyclopropane fatty-acyl-phospholipid synthase-like methyltransferase